MNHLQSLEADRPFCVTLNRTEPRSTPSTSSARSPTRTRSSRARRWPAQSRHAEISGACSARTTAAPTGAGAFTRTASSARLRRSRAMRESRCRRERALRGLGRATGASAGRPHASATACSWPTWTSTSCPSAARRPPGCGPPAHPALVRFRRADYLGDPADRRWPTPSARSSPSAPGRAPGGPIRLLTHLRSFGHCFNPVSFYYCFDAGERLQAVVAEVTNTPWGERHAYVLGGAATARWPSAFDKELHVSPFMGMDQRLRAGASAPPGAPDAVGPHREPRGRRARTSTRRSPLRPRARSTRAAAARPAPPSGRDPARAGAHLRARRAAEAQGRRRPSPAHPREAPR